MNLKKQTIYLIIALLALTSESVYSQGFFKNDATVSEDNTTQSGGIFRGPGGTGDPNGPNSGGPGENGTAAPVGEGFAILSLLSAGYFMLKKRNSKK